jgi:VIT1/CCC1 family predicted Fe2+/Mn2+ transporter
MSKPWDETWEAFEAKVFASDGDMIAEVNSRVDAAHDAKSEERARMMAAAPGLYRALVALYRYTNGASEEIKDEVERALSSARLDTTDHP